MTAEQIIKSLSESVQYVRKAGCPFVAAVIEKAIVRLSQAEQLHKAVKSRIEANPDDVDPLIGNDVLNACHIMSQEV